MRNRNPQGLVRVFDKQYTITVLDEGHRLVVNGKCVPSLVDLGDCTITISGQQTPLDAAVEAFKAGAMVAEEAAARVTPPAPSQRNKKPPRRGKR